MAHVLTVKLYFSTFAAVRFDVLEVSVQDGVACVWLDAPAVHFEALHGQEVSVLVAFWHKLTLGLFGNMEFARLLTRSAGAMRWTWSTFQIRHVNQFHCLYIIIMVIPFQKDKPPKSSRIN
jgi:hypothetical protein